MDDIVVKSRKGETLIDDLKETFDNLQVYKMMLNPTKCTFGVPAGKLMGFLVSNRVLRLTQKRSKQSLLWLNWCASMMFNVWRVVLQH